jgi:hypothetical protein
VTPLTATALLLAPTPPVRESFLSDTRQTRAAPADSFRAVVALTTALEVITGTHLLLVPDQ